MVPEATQFLEELDAERIVQLAMLADAAAEAIVITRLLDTEQCASEDVSLKLEVFLSSIKMLFLDGMCVEHGYTSFALKSLRNSIVVYVGGRPKCFGCHGAAAAAIVETCKARMQKWVRLCIDVVKAEFPNFGFLASFSVFHLPSAGECENSPLQMTEPLSERLGRLAKFAEVDPDELKSQYSEVYPAAHKIKAGGGGLEEPTLSGGQAPKPNSGHPSRLLMIERPSRERDVPPPSGHPSRLLVIELPLGCGHNRRFANVCPGPRGKLLPALPPEVPGRRSGKENNHGVLQFHCLETSYPTHWPA